MDKMKKLIKQFVGFGLVGVTNTLISLLIYYVLVYFGCHYILANCFGFIGGVINSYFLNSRLVFKNKAEKNSKKAFIKVTISYGISFGISTVLMYIMVDKLNISEYIAPLIRLVVTVPINFVLNKLWAFKDTE